MLSISNTEQYDQWKAYFVQGVEVLVRLFKLIDANPSRIPPQVSVLSEALLSIAKGLTAFLSVVSSLPPPPAHRCGKNIWQARNAWLVNNLACLRGECHRYSWTVLQIAITTENRTAAVERPQADTDGDTVTEDWRALRGAGQNASNDKYSPVLLSNSHSTSPTTAASLCSSLQSRPSSSQATSPTGSVTSPNRCVEC